MVFGFRGLASKSSVTKPEVTMRDRWKICKLSQLLPKVSKKSLPQESENEYKCNDLG
jgi:hypothetical protein